jgi:simple sugar transport system ATP-binding protein
LLGHEPHRLGSIHWRKMNQLASEAMHRLGLDIDITRPLGSYPVAIQQMAAICRALDILSARVLILDEPTSSLDIQETNLLFDVMRELKDQGLGIIFITHFRIRCIDRRLDYGAPASGELVGTLSAISARLGPRTMLGRVWLNWQWMRK